MTTAAALSAVDVVTLVDAYTSLALSVARRFARSFPALADDFTSMAGFALFRAAQRFRPRHADITHGFPPFARKRIAWALLRLLETEKRKHPTAFGKRAGPIVGSDGETLEAVDVLPDTRTSAPDHAAEYADDVDHAHALLGTLKPRRRELVIRHVAHGETLTSIGASEGVTDAAVGSVVRGAIAKLRRDAGTDNK